jgi:hypothetical protein
MRFFRSSLALIGILLLTGFMPVQEFETPLVLLVSENGHYGDLYTWTPSTEQFHSLTEWGYNERPVISPDGMMIAYNSWANATVTGIESGAPNPLQPPSNIYILDLTTDVASRLTEQPDEAAVFADGTVRGIERTTPAWSPDGVKLAWAEIEQPGGNLRLVIYDFFEPSYTEIDLSRTIPANVSLSEFPNSFQMQWGVYGLALSLTTLTAEGNTQDIILYFSNSGRLISETAFPVESGQLIGYVLDKDIFTPVDGDPQGIDIGIAIDSTGNYFSFALPGGSLRSFGYPPELYSAYIPNPNEPFYLPLDSWDTESELPTLTWQILPLYYSEATSIPNAVHSLSYQGNFTSITLAPDEHIIAFTDDGVLYLWENMSIRAISGTGSDSDQLTIAGVAWSYPIWTNPLREMPALSFVELHD